MLDSKQLYINMTSIPDKTSVEYNEFWKEETRKIQEGVTVNGYHFSPFLYWHLNFWSIYIDTLMNGRVIRKLGRPQFWDSIETIDAVINEADNLENKKGVLIIGSRRLAKSVFSSSYVAHKAVAYKGSEVLVSGVNQPDIKVLTDYIDLGLRNLPEYFRFSRIEDDWKKCVTLGYKDKTTSIRNEWSKIHVRNFDEGNNTEAAAGLTLSGFLLDEAGKAKILNCFAAATPCFDSPYGWRCVPILTGTGGDMKKSEDVQKIFNDPESYNFLAVNTREDGTKVSLFIPGTKSLKVPREPVSLSDYKNIPKGSELDNVTVWVADEEKGRNLILKSREQIKKADGVESYLKQIMYYPLTPEECFLDASENIFPVDLVQEQLRFIENNQIRPTYVELYEDIDNKVRHKFTEKKPVQSYPANPKQDLEGVVQIWEFPKDDAPFSLYTAGCLPPGEKVLTVSGLKNIEEVTLEDRLISRDGKDVKILNLQTYEVKDENIFKIKVSNTFRTTTFTGEHPILTSGVLLKPCKINSDTQFLFKEMKNINVGEWIKVPNIYKKIKPLNKSLWDDTYIRKDRRIDNPLEHKDFWWLVGLWLGDGWINNNYKVSFAINENQNFYLEKIKRVTDNVLNRRGNQRLRKGAFEYNITSQQFSSFLTENFGKYASGKRIPEWVKYLDHKYKIQLLLGYLASDGCVTFHTKGYGSIEFVSINLELLESFQDILFSLGIVSSLSRMRESEIHLLGEDLTQTKTCYHLRLGNKSTIDFAMLFSGEEDLKLKKINTNDLSLFGKGKRKGCFLSEDEDFIYFQIKKIEQSFYTGKVYNFECDTHTFMCHHITTHNCDPYKHSQAVYSTSLGATYIYKRINSLNGEGWRNMPVACYVGRPKDIDKWYDMTKKLLKFYNARALCENMDYGFIQHCVEKKEAHIYLEKTPAFLTDIHPNSTVKRLYGIHMTQEIKQYLVSCLLEYINETVSYERDDDGKIIAERKGISRILDPLLLKEMLKFSYKANCDRIIAFGLTVAMARDLNTKIIVSSTEDNRYKSYLNLVKKIKSPFRTTSNPFRSI